MLELLKLKHFYSLLIILGLSLCFNLKSEAQLAKYQTKKYTLSQQEPVAQEVNERSITLSNKAKLSIRYAKNYSELAGIFPEHLENQLQKYQKQFGDVPPFNLKIKLLDPTSFFKLTKAPAWTNALYYQNQILLPVRKNYSERSLLRTLNHEFAHALTASISKERCPGWLDEGIAQLVEDSEHPLLRKVLQEWLSEEPLLDLNLLQAGFTKLESNLIPIAYAQSLVILDLLIEKGHQVQINNYLKNKHKITEQAFWKTVGLSPQDIDKDIIEFLNRDLEIKELQTAQNLRIDS